MEASDEIDLLELMEKHHQKFVFFYDWLINRLTNLHDYELRGLNGKQEYLNKNMESIYKHQ